MSMRNCDLCGHMYDPDEIVFLIDETVVDYGGDKYYEDLIEEGKHLCAECAFQEINYDDEDGAYEHIQWELGTYEPYSL